jgi:hypothetical protein
MSTLPPANHIQIDPNFVEDGVAELPQFLQSKENYSKLIRWYCTRWDTMDGEVIKLAYLRLLDNASGAILDVLGERIGLLRYDQNDTEYKALIKLRSFRQTTAANRPDIVTLMKILFFGENPLITKRRYTDSSGNVNNSNSFIEVVIPQNCLSDTDVSQQLDDMFPINTNLWVAQADGTPFYFVDIKDGIQPTGTGGFSDSKEASVEGLLTDWIHSSARAVKNT